MSEDWPEYVMEAYEGTTTDGHYVLVINGKEYVMTLRTAVELGKNLIMAGDEDGEDDERRSLREREDNE